LKVLRKGTVTRAELNPVLARWFDRLELQIIPRAQTTGLRWYARLTGRLTYRVAPYTVLFLVLWMTYVGRFLPQYFFRSHPVMAYLNHPMVQMPCFDFIPAHLHQGQNE